jgi:hypothetical protein
MRASERLSRPKTSTGFYILLLALIFLLVVVSFFARNTSAAAPLTRPTSTPTPTSQPGPTLTPTNTSIPGASIHLGDLDGSSAPAPNNRWIATVTITVHDQDENLIANAAVSGTWSAGATGSGTCTTNGSGQCSVSKTGLRSDVLSVVFTVGNVTLAGSTYNPAANHDPDGDSNGTAITVFKDGSQPPTPTPTITPTPTNTSVPGASLHVGDLDGSSATDPNNRWIATVSITIHDQNESLIANAAVSGTWSAGATGSGSCTTNDSGQCQISKTGLSSNVLSVVFTISNVTLTGTTYNPGANHDPDGDSDGTSITVFKDGPPPETTTIRISIASDGTEGNDLSGVPDITPDGRYVVFYSHANNLVPDDDNNFWDVFIHDRLTGETSLVSLSSNGAQGNHGAGSPAVSDDGRFVAFDSLASNFVPGDTNEARDIFYRDLDTGQTSRISVATDGSEGNGGSFEPAISGDGRYVVFQSSATNLVPADTNGVDDVFVHDTQTGLTSRLSVSSDGSQGNLASWQPDLSGDGYRVVFTSDATNLVPDDTNGANDIFLHNLLTGETSRVSIAYGGAQADGGSWMPVISADGLSVAFLSVADNLIEEDHSSHDEVFVHDLVTGQTSLVSIKSNGNQANENSSNPAISTDGRYVTFFSWATNLVPDDTNLKTDVFLHDRLTGLTTRISIAWDDAQGDGSSGSSGISADGRYIVFSSSSTNLVPGDTNTLPDVFIRDRGG